MGSFDTLSALSEYSRPTARDRAESAAKGVPAHELSSAKKPSERMLDSLRDQGYNIDELHNVLTTRGNQLIIACAGAGKTTGLVYKIIYDGITKELLGNVIDVNGKPMRTMNRVWVCTFLRSGADDLRDNMRKWQNNLGTPDFARSIKFSTMHAEFKSLLESLGVEVKIIDSKENTSILRDCAKMLGIYVNSEELTELESALSYTRNVISNDRYNADIYSDKKIAPAIVDLLISEWAKRRRILGKMDFEDLQDLLYSFIYDSEFRDERVVEAIRSRYDFIYVDEFQDTSQKQYAILRQYAKDAKKIIAIGDDDQTIYTWRGSDNSIITKIFPRDFNPTIVKLSRNYRCPSNILEPVVPSISVNEGRYYKPITAAKEGGLLRVGYGSSYADMTRLLSEGIAQDIAAGRSVAVLCRTNLDGLVPALILDRDKRIRYTVSGTGMTLDSYVGRKVLSVLNLVNGRGGAKITSALDQLEYGRDASTQAKLVSDECRTQRQRIWDLDPEELAYSAPKIAKHILTWMEWYSHGDRGMVLLLKLLNYYNDVVYARDTVYNERARSIISAIKVLSTSQKYEDVSDFIDDVTSINERLSARTSKDRYVDVQIATVHEYKGKEADSVYIWNDSEGVFPHFKSTNIEEERRLHYIACTRARKVSTIIARRDKASMFVHEMNLTNAEFMRTNLTKTF